MNELAQIVMVLLAGVLLGALFFGGLWWTVQKGLTADNPALWFGASMLLRTVVVLAGFYLIAGPDWLRMLLCLLGFIIARLIVTRLTAKRMSGKVSHAP